MSLDTPAAANLPTDDEGAYARLEGIETTTEVLPEPAYHGTNQTFVLNDVYRPQQEIPFDYGDKQLQDGSAYQHARAALYEAQDTGEVRTVQTKNGEKEYIVLLDEYEIPGTDEAVAVSLTDSRSQFGKTTRSGNFRQYFKYDLTCQPLDQDGEIQWDNTPTTSLNVKLYPQDPSLGKISNDEVNENWSPPFGSGTLVRTETTWADSSQEVQDLTIDLLEAALGYDVDELDIQRDSQRFWKGEVHQRVMQEVADEIVHVIRQSSELLARHEADIQEETKYEDGKWDIVKLRTDGWGQLGFPLLPGQDMQIKLYLPDAPAEYLEFPMDQPKVEVSLEGKPTGYDAYSVDRWDQIYGVLEQLLCSHLRWADVGTEHILQDEMSEGPHADLLQWEHPQGRRAWLRNHYESLLPDLYAEAKKADTVAVYDILHSVKRRGAATYDQIAQDVGLTKRQVTGHVARLCGDDERPGILKRITSSATVVSFSAQFWEDDAHEALDQCYPDDAADDRKKRRQERVESRLLKRTLGMTPAEQEREHAMAPGELAQLHEAIDLATGQDDHDDLDELDEDSDDLEDDDRRRDSNASEDTVRSGSRERWDLFADLELTPDELAVSLDREVLEAAHVQVRTDPYPTLGD